MGLTAAVFAAPAQATATTTGETSTVLPFQTFPSDMVVAPVGGHIFVTADASAYVDVLNMDGTPDITIPAVDPSEMVLSADGSTIYISTGQGGQGEILAVNTSTLGVTGVYQTPSVPGSLALAGGYLWAAYSGIGGVVRIDLGTGAVSSTDVSSVSYGDDLQASAAAPDVLLLTTDTSPEEIDEYDVADGTATYVAGLPSFVSGRASCAGRTALTATDVIVACGDQLVAYNLADFAVDARYLPSGEYPDLIDDVQVTPTGQIAASMADMHANVSVAYFSEADLSPVSTYGDWFGDDVDFMGWNPTGDVSYYLFESDQDIELETV